MTKQIMNRSMAILAGLRETIIDNNHLLNAAGAIFDGLLAGFVREDATDE